ncbi:Mini-ribonuclease 3 [Desmospora profundinema]|uniref:Mini-ribonuclease 3 n=1 Tax=Desmospora profundinema TaxID=1571184 RepID=A0ABU1IQA0_9BACL|nr:ribonuclease III domain-containing protein [Desmospora profundinema]MDR6226982.1 ribonuclease-3 family protein [Desmospora profundinema]
MKTLEVWMNQVPGAKRAEEMNPLLLAYLGDAVYEVFIRYHLVAQGKVRPNELHGKAIQYVSAVSQARAVRRIEHLLTEEENGILRRGRNAKSGGVPKNAKASEYRTSTGLEALIGYWHLKGEAGRLRDMMEQVILALEEGEDDGT